MGFISIELEVSLIVEGASTIISTYLETTGNWSRRVAEPVRIGRALGLADRGAGALCSFAPAPRPRRESRHGRGHSLDGFVQKEGLSRWSSEASAAST